MSGQVPVLELQDGISAADGHIAQQYRQFLGYVNTFPPTCLRVSNKSHIHGQKSFISVIPAFMSEWLGLHSWTDLKIEHVSAS